MAIQNTQLTCADCGGDIKTIAQGNESYFAAMHWPESKGHETIHPETRYYHEDCAPDCLKEIVQ